MRALDTRATRAHAWGTGARAPLLTRPRGSCGCDLLVHLDAARSFSDDPASNVPIFQLGVNAYKPFQLLCINDGTNGFVKASNASIDAIVNQVHDFFEAINTQQIERYGYGPRVLPSNHSDSMALSLGIICDGGMCEKSRFPPAPPPALAPPVGRRHSYWGWRRATI